MARLLKSTMSTMLAFTLAFFLLSPAALASPERSASSASSATSEAVLSKSTQAQTEPNGEVAPTSSISNVSNVSNVSKPSVEESTVHDFDITAEGPIGDETADTLSTPREAPGEDPAEQAPAAPRTPEDPLPNGCYLIASALDPSKVLDVADASPNSGANIQLYHSNMTAAQRFKVVFHPGKDGYYTFENLHSGKMLGVDEGAAQPGANVAQFEALASPSQRFRIERIGSNYKIISVLNPSLVLDVAASSTDDRTNIALWGDLGSTAQCFQFVNCEPTVPESTADLADGSYRLSSLLNPEFNLGVDATSQDDGAQLKLFASRTAPNQVFCLSRNDEGFYSLRSLSSGKTVHVEGANLAAGSKVIQQTDDANDPSSQWAAIDNGDGTISFISRATGQALDVAGGLVSDGNHIQTWYPFDSAAQRFYCTPTSYRVNFNDLRQDMNAPNGRGFIEPFGGFNLTQGAADQLQSAISGLESQGISVGFLLVDIATGEGLAYSPDVRFNSQSTIKGSYVLSLASQNPDALSIAGWQMERAITVSDNGCYSQLRWMFGPGYIHDWCLRAGIDPDISNPSYPNYSPKELAKLWTVNYEYLCTPQADAVRGWFNAPLNSVISSALRERYPTSSKPGWNFGDSHDAGIVWAGDRPYIMAVMSSISLNPGGLRNVVLALDNAHSESIS